MKTRLDKATDHCFAAVKELRALLGEAENDDEAVWLGALIVSLQHTADIISPPKEEWPHKVVPFVPRKKTGE